MILQPDSGPIHGDHYLPSTLDTIQWGWLPNRDAKPVLSVAPGSTVTVDSVSHEGVLEDQGRDPVAFFGSHGVAAGDVLVDARDIAASALGHDHDDGPHVVTGPIEVQGAAPGDLLRIEVLDLAIRVPYGVVSNRHGYGALPGEFPEGTVRDPEASAAEPHRYGSVCQFVEVVQRGGVLCGAMPYGDGRTLRFPLDPFMGVMGVAVDTSDPVHSVPPGQHGGNIDVNMLGVGATFYLPVQVDGALFHTGDPHYAQGDGEVALTALEAPLRSTFRLDVVRGPEADALVGALREPFGETDAHWIVCGLDPSLDEAMKKTVRSAVRFLETRVGVERATALAYLSAAADFEVSQVVDAVKGVHCVIRKADFRSW